MKALVHGIIEYYSLNLLLKKILESQDLLQQNLHQSKKSNLPNWIPWNRLFSPSMGELFRQTKTFDHSQLIITNGC